MGDLPISDAAMQAAEYALDLRIIDRAARTWGYDLARALQAFLEAEGFRIERLTPGEAVRNPYCFPERPHRRLTSRWQAEQGTPSTAGKDDNPVG